ncbi:caveolin-3-like [Tubulanus polymorphus]|uniref:caveolin-3-like n=1 Tax=Tubulanus polymorphus TaxID=672921 RepID=UPI003DA31BCF
MKKMADDRGLQLKVRGEDPDVRFEGGRQVLDERDPNGINDHLLVAFDEVFGEPDPGIHSFYKVWTLTHTVYSGVKLWMYRLLTVICGIPLMIIWGCFFACASFCTIWCCTPCLRAIELYYHCLKRCGVACMEAIYGPCYQAIGLIFSKIRVEQVVTNKQMV